MFWISKVSLLYSCEHILILIIVTGDIKLPSRVHEAMQMQVEAERRKRAAILESEGVRAADINVAEGKRQARILASGTVLSLFIDVRDVWKWKFVWKTPKKVHQENANTQSALDLCPNCSSENKTYKISFVKLSFWIERFFYKNSWEPSSYNCLLI